MARSSRSTRGRSSRPPMWSSTAEAFGSGVLLGAGAAERLIDHARQCYAAARRVETSTAVQTLPAPGRPHLDPGQGGQV